MPVYSMSPSMIPSCFSILLVFLTLTLQVLAFPAANSSTLLHNTTKPPLDAAHAKAIFAERQAAISQRLQAERNHPRSRRSNSNNSISSPLSYRNTSQSTIDDALILVKAAQLEANEYNYHAVHNVRRNKATSRKSATLARRDDTQLFKPNSTVTKAAALIAEVHATSKALNGTLHKDYSNITRLWSGKNRNLKKRDTISWWMEDVDHLGTMPFGGDPSYEVWRNVMDYGAVGDGVTDDTDAINLAISDGDRCGRDCLSSTVKGAVVYFPSGTYLVSSSIISMYNTQMVGNANEWPTIYAASYFIGLGVISSDVYIDGASGGEWYIEQSNFLRQVRNMRIDISDTTTQYPAAIHWQVAQATSLESLEIIMSDDASTTQQGIYAENGSGGFMSQIEFYGGLYGLYGGEQQFTSRGLSFYFCQTAIRMIWDWAWTWSSISINYVHIGISLEGEGGARGTGSVHLIDSQIYSSDIGIQTTPTIVGPSGGTTQITLENVIFGDVGVEIQDSDNTVIKAGAAAGNVTVSYWTLGNIYTPDQPKNGTFSGGSILEKPASSPGLQVGGQPGYFYRPKPQYEDLDYTHFVNMKDFAFGDGVTDDTTTINLILSIYSEANYVIYFPAGSYIVTDTIKVPPGARIVGECWAQIVAYGANFQSLDNPHIMVQVGNVGDTGIVEIQDMLFTARGPTAGVVLMEWNIKESNQGSAALWDSHFRIGGALGTQLQVADCPILSTSVNNNCLAGAMHLHLTSTSSAYLENMWIWTADHDIDDAANTQVDIYVSRGILIESQGPTWLYGTASEHNIFYQYELYNATSTFMGMIQTETPYWSGGPNVDAIEQAMSGIEFNGDPSFFDCPATAADDIYKCNAAWALRIIESNDVTVAGAGLYSWYQNYNEGCVATYNCQQRMVETIASGMVWISNIVTIGVLEMVVPHNELLPTLAEENLNSVGYPDWSAVATWSVLENNFVVDEVAPDPINDPTLDITRSLYQFTKCAAIDNPAMPSDAVAQIKQGYSDAHTIATAKGVFSGIDWNSAAALEFFGPPGEIGDEKAKIQANLLSASKVEPRWNDWWKDSYIQVRCDDPAKRCSCNNGKVTIAYTANNYDDTGYPMVNFCPAYFDKDSLADAVESVWDLTDLLQYDNQGRVWLHEMMHMDPVAQNPHIRDWRVSIGGELYNVYGPELTKVIARYNGGPGLYTSRSADNYAWYATAMYAQGLNGFYPHKPVVFAKPVNPPTPSDPFTYVLPNFTDDYTKWDIGNASLSAACNSDTDVSFPDDGTVLEITSLSPDDQYPADYITQLRTWQAETAPPISTDGHCGANGNTCQGSTFGNCCSVKGNCGSTPAFCGVSNGCQAGFGICTPVSTDGKCGSASSTNAMCTGSTFGNCCSVKGNCGSTPAFCGVSNACQPMFGTCTPVSTDGKCGSASSTNAMCTGSGFGDCCSVKGNCGSTPAFCGVSNACQPMFGTCTPVSTDGKCGSASSTNAMCTGSTFGNCCSVKGNCGSTAAFCAIANLCQPMFGTCT